MSSVSLFEVFDGVVEPAEELAFFHRGLSAVGPVVEVVDVAPLWGSLTAWLPGSGGRGR